MMIQDIEPARLDNSYRHAAMAKGDALMLFDAEGRIAVSVENGRIRFPAAGESGVPDAVYLFRVDERNYFLVTDEAASCEEEFSYQSLRALYPTGGGAELYAAFTAYHLWRWYADNRFCGRCAGRMRHAEEERALCCPDCGSTVYPRINPAVIVGVKNGDSLLLTRYRNGYAHNALVAGFTEIGETVEETVRREVMEETGIKVKNIRYYKSQPWGIAQDILMGFYCEADGDTGIRMDESELKYAEWVKREEITLQPDDLSLTNEMMRIFKEGIER